jgi:hypothetical protein
MNHDTRGEEREREEEEAVSVFRKTHDTIYIAGS